MTCLEKHIMEHPEGEKVDEEKRIIIDNPISPEDLKDLKKALGVVSPSQPHILDSGNRRKFESGAVRDIQEGKGRCDLLPLDVVAEYLCRFAIPSAAHVIGGISDFQETGNENKLFDALYIFVMNRKSWGLDHFTMFLEVSIHFEEGAKKYGDRNWQKGIPVRCYIDSAVRHYLKYLRGDKDEPHDRAFCWNILCAIWTCKHMPELNEYPVDSGEVSG